MKQVLAARHTGLVVKDLERSLAFYTGLLGLELLSRAREQGPYIENLVGLPGAVLDWAKLRIPGGHLLELLQYSSHPEAASAEELGRASRPGCSHLALTVADVDALFEALVAAGLRCNHAPQFSPDGKVKVMYAHDPDGIILELVQELK